MANLVNVYQFKDNEAKEAYDAFKAVLQAHGFAPTKNKNSDDSIFYFYGGSTISWPKTLHRIAIELYDDCRWYVFEEGKGTNICLYCGTGYKQFELALSEYLKDA